MKIHKSVLLEESIEALNLKKGDVVVDATLGSSGHSREILKKIGDEGKLIGIDFDKKNITESDIKSDKRVLLINENFSNIEEIMAQAGIEKVDSILADLGYSSDQLEDPEYGMSFLKEGRLNMRLDGRDDLTAFQVVNEYDQEKLEKIIRDFGEEKFARRIASGIVEKRKEKNIETTKELAEIIKSCIPARQANQKIHPATRTFQAIRIEVNAELENLESFLKGSIKSLKRGGRLAVISFHSLEDRIIKNIFRENARGCICPSDFPQCVCGKEPQLKVITKKPIVAQVDEVMENPRSRSAKLRVAEKI